MIETEKTSLGEEIETGIEIVTDLHPLKTCSGTDGEREETAERGTGTGAEATERVETGTGIGTETETGTGTVRGETWTGTDGTGTERGLRRPEIEPRRETEGRGAGGRQGTGNTRLNTLNPFMPGGRFINHLFFNFLSLMKIKIKTVLMSIMFHLTNITKLIIWSKDDSSKVLILFFISLRKSKKRWLINRPPA